jgi:hypothetical protein
MFIKHAWEGAWILARRAIRTSPETGLTMNALFFRRARKYRGVTVIKSCGYLIMAHFCLFLPGVFPSFNRKTF